MYAAQVGNFELIKALIGKNVPLSSLSEDTGQNCMMIALQAGKYDLLFQIIEYIINLKPFNQQCRDYGETIIMKCLIRNILDIPQALLQKPGIQIGVFKDKQGKTELIHTVERNSVEGTRLIVEAAKRTK